MSQKAISAEIVEPYAEALMSVAQSQDLVDSINEDVSQIVALLRESPDLQEFLGNPLTNAQAKKVVIRQILEDGVQTYTLNFLMLLVDRRRIFLLKDICRYYQSLVRKLNNTVLAEVTSTVDLNQEQRQTVVEKVKAMTGAQEVDLETSLDQDLIGGIIVKVGSQVLDASIRGQLRRLTNTLTRPAS